VIIIVATYRRVVTQEDTCGERVVFAKAKSRTEALDMVLKEK